MAVIAQQQPIEPLLVIPLDELRELVAHKIELFARVRHLIAIEYTQVCELAVIIARHFFNERALAVYDLVVAERQDEVFGIGVGHGERQRVVAALAPQRVERHIVQHIVHPAHVPLKQEAQPAVIIGLGDERKGGGLLRDHERRGVCTERRRVELAQKVDGVQIFLAAEFVGLILPAVIVKVQHGRHGVHPQPVGVELLQPVDGVGDEERPHLRLCVVKNARAPFGMLPHLRVGELVAAASVKFKQPVFVLRKMRRHPVQDHAEVCLMAGVHKIAELLRAAVAVRGGKIARHLIAPRRLIRKLHHGHQLNMRVAHALYIRDELPREVVKGVVAAVLMPLPRPGVHLVDVHRAPERVLPLFARAVQPVVPDMAAFRFDHAGGIRQRAAAAGIGVGFIHRAPVRPAHAEFICPAGLCVHREHLPHAAADGLHGKIVHVPEIKITDDTDRRGAGRPHAEQIAVGFITPRKMAAQIRMRVIAAVRAECLEELYQSVFHPSAPCWCLPRILFPLYLEFVKYSSVSCKIGRRILALRRKKAPRTEVRGARIVLYFPKGLSPARRST